VRASATRLANRESTMGPRTSLLLILGVLGAIMIRMSVFTVDAREHAVKFRIGRIVDSTYEPGLHFKIPLFENVARYPNRVLILDENSREQFLTGEKKSLIVNYYVNWRVVDPAQYYRSVRADKETAEARLSAIVKEGIRAAIGRRTLQEVVSAERTELMAEMLVQVQERPPELGIEVVDVRVKRIDLADDVSESVFSRMRQERTAVATQLRAEGEEEYVRVRADADRQRTVILAEGPGLLRVLSQHAGVPRIDRQRSRRARLETRQRVLQVPAEPGRLR
jgi:membrane protease subunit HflC